MMIIEVAGVFTENKGAELMLMAILERYGPSPALEFAVSRHFGAYRDRAKYGLRTKIEVTRFGRSRMAAWLMPASFRMAYGLAAEADIQAVLDASGFAFSDQLGPERTEQFAADVTRWKRQGKPVVLLPQAFGPFQEPRLRQAMHSVLEQTDLIFARDETSLQHLRQLGGREDNVRLAPDFTCLVQPIVPESFPASARQACIVLNHRMVEKAGFEDRERYIPLMANCVRELERCDLQPYVLLHDQRVDESLVAPLQAALGQELTVVRETDPKKLKGILGTAQVVIASRFHALVSSMSQGVPSIAVGWSHKYEMLLAEYGCPECRLTPSSTTDEVRDVIHRAVDQRSRQRLVVRLQESSAKIRQDVREMWERVDAVIQAPGLGRAADIRMGSPAA